MAHITTVRNEFEFEISASPARVWATMVEDIGSWWPADYRAAEAGSTFHFEARIGGSVWEKSAFGGLEWFRVQALEAGSWVNLVGFTGPPWGGPSITMLRIDLDERDDGSTTLRVTDATLGAVSETAAQGWRTIFAGLQAAASR